VQLAAAFEWRLHEVPGAMDASDPEGDMAGSRVHHHWRGDEAEADHEYHFDKQVVTRPSPAADWLYAVHHQCALMLPLLAG
jgi:hypothetical protein